MGASISSDSVPGIWQGHCGKPGEEDQDHRGQGRAPRPVWLREDFRAFPAGGRHLGVSKFENYEGAKDQEFCKDLVVSVCFKSSHSPEDAAEVFRGFLLKWGVQTQ